MKNKLFLLILLLFAGSSYAQVNKFPDGVYLTWEQLKNQKPAYNADLRPVERSGVNTLTNDRNDYYFESDIDSINKKYIKKKIYAYAKNNSVYLNCINYNLGSGYALALTCGGFLAFKASPTDDKIAGSTFIGGTAAGEKAYEKRVLYVLSLRTGNVRLLTKEYLEARLKEIPEFEKQYNQENEKDKESQAVLLKYIALLDTKVFPYTEISTQFDH
jgi:hypothetical protein